MSSYSQFFGGGGSSGGGDVTAINQLVPYFFGIVDNNPVGWNYRQSKFVDPNNGAVYLKTGTTEIDTGSVYPQATFGYTVYHDGASEFYDYRSQVAAPYTPMARVDFTGSVYMISGSNAYKYAANSPWGYTGESIDAKNDLAAPYSPNNTIGDMAFNGKYFYAMQGLGPGATGVGFDFGGTVNDYLFNAGTFQGPDNYFNPFGYNESQIIGSNIIGLEGEEERVSVRFRSPTNAYGPQYATKGFSRPASSSAWTGNQNAYGSTSDNAYGFFGGGVNGTTLAYNNNGSTFYDLKASALTTGSYYQVSFSTPTILGASSQTGDGHKLEDYFWVMANNTMSLMEFGRSVGIAQAKNDSTGQGYPYFVRIS